MLADIVRHQTGTVIRIDTKLRQLSQKNKTMKSTCAALFCVRCAKEKKGVVIQRQFGATCFSLHGNCLLLLDKKPITTSLYISKNVVGTNTQQCTFLSIFWKPACYHCLAFSFFLNPISFFIYCNVSATCRSC